MKSSEIKLSIAILLIGILVVVVIIVTNSQAPPPLPPTFFSCTSFDYSNWSQCTTRGTQNRTITKALPEGCKGGNPILFQSCKYKPTLTPPPTTEVVPVLPLIPDPDYQAQVLTLTDPLFEKYIFLNNAIDLSLQLFEGMYQRQQESIAVIQGLQSTIFRSDVAEGLAYAQEESNKLLGVIVVIKDEQSHVRWGIETLNAANKTFALKPIDEGFRKFVNDEIESVDVWIYVFNPENPDNVAGVAYARDRKIYELLEVLLQGMKITQ